MDAVKDVEEAIFTDLDGDGKLEVVSGTEGEARTLYWHRLVGDYTSLPSSDANTDVDASGGA